MGEVQRQGFGSQLFELIPNLKIERVFDGNGLRQRTTVPRQFFNRGDWTGARRGRRRAG